MQQATDVERDERRAHERAPAARGPGVHRKVPRRRPAERSAVIRLPGSRRRLALAGRLVARSGTSVRRRGTRARARALRVRLGLARRSGRFFGLAGQQQPERHRGCPSQIRAGVGVDHPVPNGHSVANRQDQAITPVETYDAPFATPRRRASAPAPIRRPLEDTEGAPPRSARADLARGPRAPAVCMQRR
jgi:hypothetical protein